MQLFEIALCALLVAACAAIFVAFARRWQSRRRDFIPRAHDDERDTLARFRRTMGRRE